MNLFNNEQLYVKKIFAVHKYENSLQDVRKKPIVRHGSTIQYCQLIYFLYGDNTVIFDGITIYDKTDSVRFLPAYYTNEYIVKRKQADRCIDILFSYEGEIYSKATALYDMQALKPKFEKIYNLWLSNTPGCYLKCMSLLYEIISGIFANSRSYISNLQKSKLNAAHDYIMKNYKSTGFDYKELCSTTGFSYSYFKSVFKKYYGISPIKFVTKLRMQYACELLITAQYNVTEISEMCGYDNVYYFSKVFKDFTGVSPSKYKHLSDGDD